MFIVALFTIAKRWKQLQCPSVDEWIKLLRDIYTMKYYSAVKRKKLLPFVTTGRDLKNISQTAKGKYHRISLICGI